MSETRVENRDRLQELLRELFQFDASDLDFGIYRILNQRRDRIDQFIEEDLMDAVEEGLEELSEGKREEIQAELEEKADEVRETVGEDAIDEDGSVNEEYARLKIPVIREYEALLEDLEQASVSEETKSRVFNDLYRFFSRYYQDGDFHSKRRISGKDDKYVIPYDGEEVHFHWANHDQYYVKSSEHFVDYRFTAGDYTIEFKLVEATVPQDNVKDDSRYFVLDEGAPVTFDEGSGAVTVRFQYRPITEDEADEIVEKYNDATGDNRSSFAHMNAQMRCAGLEGEILSHVDHRSVESALSAPDDPTAEESVTRLRRNLNRYVSENSMDYFVHKDLDGFLRNELDFFLKNEVLSVDDVLAGEETTSPAVLRARTVQTIADRVITFLAQIEDFQKRLFEKKKFVTQTDYMVTLDQVPDDLYEEILANEEQLEQWREVYNTEEWDTDLKWQGRFDDAFVQNHPYVMVDTNLFDDEFKSNILSGFDDIDDEIDGVLINGENFQSLNLLSAKYSKRAHSVYIDPPYNTGEGDFIFKDNFKDSSWLSMMKERLKLGFKLLEPSGTFLCHIDEHEISNLLMLMNRQFGEHNNLGEIIWNKRNPKGDSNKVAIQHEYILSWAKDFESFKNNNNFVKSKENARKMIRKSNRLFKKVDSGDLTLEEANSKYQAWLKNRDLSGGEAAYKYIDSDGNVYRPVSMAWPNKNDPSDDYKYDLTHPETGEVCKKPKRGWRFPSNTLKQMNKDGKIIFGEDHTTVPNQKYLLKDNVVENLPSVLSYGGSADQTFSNLGLHFDENPKPIEMSSKVLEPSLRLSDPEHDLENPLVVDFFAGSGTTGHTAIEMERQFGKDIDYLMVEMGEHFDSVLKPRIQKVVHSANWKEGVPQDSEGISHFVKYMRIESYEDTLNNIKLTNSGSPQQALSGNESNEYLNKYILDFESQGSASLLPDDTFDEPFCHELDIEQNEIGREPTTVDLVETFHYLIGADVRQYWREDHQDRKYVVTGCETETESGVEKVLTAWRPTEGLDLTEEQEWFNDEFDSASYDRVYVNGESHITGSEPLTITFREKMEESPYGE